MMTEVSPQPLETTPLLSRLFLQSKHFYFLCKGDPENLYKGGGGAAEQGASRVAQATQLQDRTGLPSPPACPWGLMLSLTELCQGQEEGGQPGWRGAPALPWGHTVGMRPSLSSSF